MSGSRAIGAATGGVVAGTQILVVVVVGALEAVDVVAALVAVGVGAVRALFPPHAVTKKIVVHNAAMTRRSGFVIGCIQR